MQLAVEAATAGTSGIKKTVIDPEDAEFTAKTIQWYENTYISVSPSLCFYFK